MYSGEILLVTGFISVVVVINLLIKFAADRLENKALAVFCQYSFAALLAFAYSLSSGGLDLSWGFAAAGIIGTINAWANYANWEAYAISLSRTAVFLPFGEVLGISLAIVFLGEANIWDWQLALGVSLCFVSMWAPKVIGYRHADVKRDVRYRQWVYYVSGFVVVLAFITFLTKLLASAGIPRGIFLPGFYGGSMFGAFLVLMRSKQRLSQVTGQMLSWTAAVALGLVLAQGLMYSMFQTDWALSVVLPIRGVSMSVFPALIGYFLVREGKAMPLSEKVLFALGFAGALLLVLR